MLRDNDGAVPLPEASSAIEQHVLIAEVRVRPKAKRRHVIDFLGGRLVERFNVGQDVGELQAGRAHLLCGQPVEHESIVGVR